MNIPSQAARYRHPAALILWLGALLTPTAARADDAGFALIVVFALGYIALPFVIVAYVCLTAMSAGCGILAYLLSRGGFRVMPFQRLLGAAHLALGIPMFLLGLCLALSRSSAADDARFLSSLGTHHMLLGPLLLISLGLLHGLLGRLLYRWAHRVGPVRPLPGPRKILAELVRRADEDDRRRRMGKP